MKKRTYEESEELVYDLAHKLQLKNLKISIDKKYVSTGKRSRTGLDKGRTTQHGTPEQQQARWAEWQAWINETSRKSPKLSFNALTKIAGKQFNCSPRTIYRHCKNPKK
jgi:hypothetical protein